MPRSRNARAIAWWLSFGVTMLTTSMPSGRLASAAAISAKLLQQLGGGTVFGPILCGLAHSAQIVQTGATVSEIVTAAAQRAQ